MRVRQPIPRKYRYDRLVAERQLYFRNGTPASPATGRSVWMRPSTIFDPSQIAKRQQSAKVSHIRTVCDFAHIIGGRFDRIFRK
ncbi:MAG: hypothetical protein WBW73_20080 [Rhodoplanes sp.]